MSPRILAAVAVLAIGAAGVCHAGSYSNDFSTNQGAASLRRSAIVDSGSLRLTPNGVSQEGSLVIDDLDPGARVTSFDARFDLAIGPGSVPPADGVSFSFGAPPAATYGENGTGAGLAIVFDIYDNGEIPTPPVIRVLLDGTQTGRCRSRW